MWRLPTELLILCHLLLKRTCLAYQVFVDMKSLRDYLLILFSFGEQWIPSLWTKNAILSVRGAGYGWRNTTKDGFIKQAIQVSFTCLVWSKIDVFTTRKVQWNKFLVLGPKLFTTDNRERETTEKITVNTQQSCIEVSLKLRNALWDYKMIIKKICDWELTE